MEQPPDLGADIQVSFDCPNCRLRNTFLGYSNVFIYPCGQCGQQVDINKKPPAEAEG